MWVAAESGDLATALIPAVWTFLGVVVVTLGTVAVQSMKTRAERRTSEPVSATSQPDSSLLHVAREVARDIGQLDRRAEDSDRRFDQLDRARSRDREDLDDILDYLDHQSPNWRTE